MSSADFDHHMMRIALRMARRGLGETAPNPAVGAVIADPATGEVIARASTQPGGRPHAETVALERAGERARGAVMYVTLEPCAHHGQTPPCADAVIAAGLARVVVAIEDPDPRTAGQGIARLRAAGIAVDIGLLADEARLLTLGHILRVTEGRPFVTLKIASLSDGSVPRGEGGHPRWVTGADARAAGHLLRASSDAILVGAATLRDDDPELTCRLPGLEEHSPVAIVLSKTLALPPEAKLWARAADGPVWVFTVAEADDAARKRLAGRGVEVAAVAADTGGVSLEGVMSRLAERGITRLLVEGGPSVWRSFAAEGLVDEAVLFVAGGSLESAAAGRALPTPETILMSFLPSADLCLADERAIGDDRMIIFRREARA